MPVFKTGAINHSATSPLLLFYYTLNFSTTLRGAQVPEARAVILTAPGAKDLSRSTAAGRWYANLKAVYDTYRYQGPNATIKRIMHII
jgi:hypothetical protein